MLIEIQRERPPNLEDVSNGFSMTIDKDTYYVTRYNIYREGSAVDDFGEYLVTTKGYVSLDRFNEYDDITVPDEVLSGAEPVE